MPLPDAEPGKKSNLYAQLRSSQVGSASITNFDKVKEPVFVNQEWEDEARRLKLWGELMGLSSSSGPMPGTCQIVEASVTVSNLDVELFTPAAGEVWLVTSCGIVMTSGAQSGTAYLKIEEVADTTKAVIVAEMATGGSIESFDNDWGAALYIDENISLIARYYKSGGIPGGDSANYSASLIRVR